MKFPSRRRSIKTRLWNKFVEPYTHGQSAVNIYKFLTVIYFCSAFALFKMVARRRLEIAQDKDAEEAAKAGPEADGRAEESKLA